MTSIYIYGCGGFGREVLQIIRDLRDAGEPIECAGFLVDEGYAAPEMVHGIQVYHLNSDFQPTLDAQYVIAIGAPQAKRRIVNSIQPQRAVTFATLIHPRAWIGRNVKVGSGCIICAGTAITTDITIGHHVHVNILSTIGHDTTVGDYVTISPGANISGNVHLGDGCEIGTGVSVIPGVSIGEGAVIGAGASVVRSIAHDVVAVGVPAKSVKTREDGWRR